MYDCIVVGAGPGGSAAAASLAAAGLAVLVMEKETLPRDKPCGGALSAKAARLLNVDFASVTEDVLTNIKVHYYRSPGPPLEYSAPAPIAYMITRAAFDSLLAEEAAGQGAVIHDGEGVTGLEFDPESVTVQSAVAAYKGKVVIAADGARSLLARAAGLWPGRTGGMALEVEAQVPDTELSRWRSTALVSYGRPRRGYAWLFPKRYHLSLGIGSFAPRPGNLIRALTEFTDSLQIPWQRQDLRAHPIPTGGSARSYCRPRLLLVGDAAGLCDPLSGEGMAYALESGFLAAASVLNALATGDFTLADYQRQVERQVNSRLSTTAQIATLLYTFPGAVYRFLAGSTKALGWYFDAIRGERNYQDVLSLIKSLQPQNPKAKEQRANGKQISP